MVDDSARDILYITDGGSVLRYHLSSNTFMTPFAIGGNLGGIDISPDGNTLVIADRRRLDPNVWVYVIKLQTEQLQQILFPRAFYEGGTYTVAYANDSTLITSTFEGSGWVPLRKLNPITGAWSELATVRHNSMVTASGDLGVVGFAEADSSDGPFGRYRVADGNLLRKSGYTDGTAWFNYEIGVNRDGTQFAIPTYNGTYICDANLFKFHLVGQYAGPQPIGVVYHPVEGTVYFAWSGSTEVRAFDTTSFAQMAAYDFEHTFTGTGNNAFTQGRLKMSRDGSLLFATVEGGVRYLRFYEPLAADSQSVSTNEDSSAPIILSGSVGNGGPYPTSLPPNASSAPATVSIIVYPLNDAPNAQPDAATTFKNTAVNIAVLANDADVDGDVLSLTAVTQGANGTVTFTGGGTGVNYRPKASFTGTDTFTYTVSDGNGGTATTTVTITVIRR